MKRVALAFDASLAPPTTAVLRDIVERVRLESGRVVTAILLPSECDEAGRLPALLRQRIRAGEFEAVIPVGEAATTLGTMYNRDGPPLAVGERAAIYARSATARRAHLTEQVSRCTSYVDDQGGSLAITYVDRCQSGGTLGPSLKRMLADAEAGAFKAIVADEPSRISRDSRRVRKIVERLALSSVRLLTVDGSSWEAAR